ncbi:MAG: hypothetical protein AB8B65_20930 [Kordia sp.]|uniref:hypothetical protein n=1 Tax=Kordia sp. TaxID=1965332 RepID=UPI00385C61D1
MRYLGLFIILCCLLSCATETQRIDICYPDKGIKTAKEYVEYNPENYRLTEYNEEGVPIRAEHSEAKKVYDHVYSNDTLQYTIVTNLDRDTYTEGELDSSSVDTLFVTKHQKDPRRYLFLELESTSGTRIEFTSVDCRKESLIVSDEYGKIQDIEMFKKDGIYSKVIAIYYEGKKETIVVSNYINYKFDSHGHWIERTERLNDGSTTIEIRALEHY